MIIVSKEHKILNICVQYSKVATPFIPNN